MKTQKGRAREWRTIEERGDTNEKQNRAKHYSGQCSRRTIMVAVVVIVVDVGVNVGVVVVGSTAISFCAISPSVSAPYPWEASSLSPLKGNQPSKGDGWWIRWPPLAACQ